MNSLPPRRPDRREAIKWMLAASSAAMLSQNRLWAQPENSPGPASAAQPEGASGPAGMPSDKGYGTDPDLLKTYKPGDLWPLTFDDSQRAEAAALCEAIIPADEVSPGAGSLGVHDFIDEWISAPYPAQRKDRPIVLKGLKWLDQESLRRYGIPFVDTIVAQKHAIIDDICFEAKAKPPFKEAAHFFKRFRDLTAGGFYTTPVGMKDVGYVGNVPLASFDGPPAELIKKLGLEEAASV